MANDNDTEYPQPHGTSQGGPAHASSDYAQEHWMLLSTAPGDLDNMGTGYCVVEDYATAR